MWWCISDRQTLWLRFNSHLLVMILSGADTELCYLISSCLSPSLLFLSDTICFSPLHCKKKKKKSFVLFPSKKKRKKKKKIERNIPITRYINLTEKQNCQMTSESFQRIYLELHFLTPLVYYD